MGVRLAVIGSGAWGLNHVRTATRLRDAELTVVCDPSSAARQRALATAPGARAVESPEEVLGDATVDAVIIAAPAPTHARLALAAVEAHKHVLVEKPFVLDPADGQRIVQAAHARGRTLMVGHVLRYHPHFQHLEALAREGALGRVRHLYGERVNLGGGPGHENVLWSLAPHDVSMMCALVPAPPVEVSATGHAPARGAAEDAVFVSVRFADGALGHVHASWLHPEKRRRLTVVGPQQIAVFDDMEPTAKLRLYAPRAEAARAPEVPMIEPLHAEQQHFVDCVREGATPRTDGREALLVSRCLLAAQQSLAAGGAPVRVA